MQAEIVCLRQARRYRAQTRKVGRSIKTIHDSDVAAKLKEYAALLEEVERFGNALRQTLLAQLQEDSSPLEKEISLDNGDEPHSEYLAATLKKAICRPWCGSPPTEAPDRPPR